LYLFNNTLWVPHYDINYIGQYDLSGQLLGSVKHYEIIEHRALHHLHSDYLIVAAKSGLFKINTNGMIEHKISNGYFWDVHIHQHIAALDTYRWESYSTFI
jgi:hypothetical protein